MERIKYSATLNSCKNRAYRAIFTDIFYSLNSHQRVSAANAAIFKMMLLIEDTEIDGNRERETGATIGLQKEESKYMRKLARKVKHV